MNKLINSVSKKETICDKVVVDGFDYYVSDEPILTGDYKYHHVTGLRKALVDGNYTNQKKIIATTNPSIDIPKVVDEVEMLAWESTNEKYPDVNDESSSQDELNIWNSNWMGFQEGYNKSQETHPFSEEDMIDFKNWWLKQDIEWFDNTEEGDVYKLKNGKTITDKELLQLWKEQKPKIVYYE